MLQHFLIIILLNALETTHSKAYLFQVNPTITNMFQTKSCVENQNTRYYTTQCFNLFTARNRFEIN